MVNHHAELSPFIFFSEWNFDFEYIELLEKLSHKGYCQLVKSLLEKFEMMSDARKFV
jgi:hypothetical protein